MELNHPSLPVPVQQFDLQTNCEDVNSALRIPCKSWFQTQSSEI